MDRNFSRSLALVLKSEGGFSNNPMDKGGPTNRGVTLATFLAYVDPHGTVDDLKRITDAQLYAVYKRQYWDVVHGAELPDGVDYAVFDFAVNSGPDRAKRYLQAVVGVAQDGMMGPGTKSAVLSQDPVAVINALCDKRLTFLKGLKSWLSFGKGWSSRVTSVRAEALAMAKTPAETPAPAKPSAVVIPFPTPEKPPLVGAIISALLSLFGKK